MGEELSRSLESYLGSAMPHVIIRSMTIRNVEVPDVELYTVAKELYLDLARKRQESYAAALAEITWTESRSQQHFDVIERYGELITRYPTLLELFKLKGGELGTILNEIDAFIPRENVP
jgi:hypothetical protein